MSGRAAPMRRGDFRRFSSLGSRWADVDVFGHVNNAVYYAWFDTAVCGWLAESGLSRPGHDATLYFVVETSCTYFDSVEFPETVEVGIAVEKLGRSSATYRIGVFRAGRDEAAAQGRFTHVYVDPGSRRPVAIPEAVRAGMAAIAISG